LENAEAHLVGKVQFFQNDACRETNEADHRVNIVTSGLFIKDADYSLKLGSRDGMAFTRRAEYVEMIEML
jgi:hypothetical protein